ncbi:MAG: hypothetical protein JSV89_00965 [Spirochaetaceae bacterium]|nr:MAG: hypothetical protein JSV89_00965 [Spirochaetaceae bacterium]
MRFDLADLPDFITWAGLTLYYNTASVTADISVHRILKPWDRATVTWSEVNQPDVFYT